MKSKLQSGLIALVMVLGVMNSAQADPPSLLAMFKKKSDKNTPVKLATEHGPWLIVASVISGDNAEAKAQSLAVELQNILNTNCYVLDKMIDNSGMLKVDQYQTQKLDGTIATRKVRFANQTKEQVYAVLVGDFNALEDPRVEPMLEKIRVIKPTTLVNESENQSQDLSKPTSTNFLVASYRKFLYSRDKDGTEKGPMRTAFLTRNPLLPEDFFQSPKVDTFVANLNEKVEHSLLKCPGRFTVRVATFQGKSMTDFEKSESKPLSTSDMLDYAAEKANTMVMSLRKRGVEAYEFHDKYASYVTIGSFDELGKQDALGQFQYDPKILAVMEEWCGYRILDARDPRSQALTKVQSLKSEAQIPFDIEGKPMAVPRLATSKLYGGSLLGTK